MCLWNHIVFICRNTRLTEIPLRPPAPGLDSGSAGSSPSRELPPQDGRRGTPDGKFRLIIQSYKMK